MNPVDTPTPVHESQPRAPGARQLVLLGAGHAHVQLLSTWAVHPIVGVQVTLVSPYPRQLVSTMVPDFVAGHFGIDECAIALEPLVRRCGIRWLVYSACGLDAQTQTILTTDGSTLRYDWLSVNTGGIYNREQVESLLPGAKEHALFVRPLENFGKLWPRVAAMGDKRPLRLAVIGSEPSSIELALAVRHRLPQAAITIVAGDVAIGLRFPLAARQRIEKQLKERRITVLQDTALSITAQSVQLGCGATLACDAALFAPAVQAPEWLQDCGLALDDQGFIAVDQYQRSTSHARVFATGAVSARADCTLPSSAELKARSGKLLTNNLLVALDGGALQVHRPKVSPLHLLSCGNRYAIASWGKYSAEGRWVWWIKNWMDRRLLARYTRPV